MPAHARTRSIADAAREFIASPAPLLLLDTCAILDVIRAPNRGNANCIQSAAELAARAESSPPELHIVVAPVIPAEWSEHAPDVRTQLETHVRRVDKAIGYLRRACDLAGVHVDGPAGEYSKAGLPDRLHAIAARLYDAAIVLAVDETCRLKAAERTIGNRPPARKGKGTKDSDIVEHYLEFCRELASRGYEKRVVFVSSNTNDFCERDATMHAPLLSEFACVDFRFTTNLAWAKVELGL